MLILILSILVLGTIISSLYITLRFKPRMSFKQFYANYMITKDFKDHVLDNKNNDDDWKDGA